MIDCDECDDFEFRRDHPIRWRREQLLQQLSRPSPFTAVSHLGMAMAMTYGVMGGSREPTHYERHRDEFVRTGDDREMERMLRQVKQDA